MSKKLLYKEELDNIFKNDGVKPTVIPKTKKIKKSQDKNIKVANTNKDSLFSEKFSKGRRANSINEGLILPKLKFDQ